MPNLRIVEVFPKEGNTGLAARGLVMLSEKMWFSAPIGDKYDSIPAVVLVDECAHQWNAYHVQFPNYLAEGISEYTDNLFMERFVDSNWMATTIAAYRKAYTNIVDLIARLKPFKDRGQTVEQAAQALGLPLDNGRRHSGRTPRGASCPSPTRACSRPSTSSRAPWRIHALRTQIGDEQFFQGFKKLFAVGTSEPVTLDYYRQCFESVHGASLANFFQRWYNEPGLPDPSIATR